MNLKPLAVGAATIGLIALAGPAFAAGPPYIVSVGGSSAPGSHAITAASTATVQLNFRNNSGQIVNFNCSSIALTGTATSGTGVNPFATITSTTWNGCGIPGLPSTITHAGVWGVAGTGSNATSGTETVASSVTNVVASSFTTANPAVCSFTISGSVNASFKEASGQQLILSETGYTGNLALSNVSGCLGRLQNGNPANLVTTLNVTSPDGAINLS